MSATREDAPTLDQIREDVLAVANAWQSGDRQESIALRLLLLFQGYEDAR